MRFIDIILHEFKIDMPSDDEGMGIPRKKMPQIKTADYPEYFKYLKDNGVEFQKINNVKATSLKPIQSEFSKQGVEKQLNKIYNDLDDGAKPLIASSDNYIIDGHHRWLAAKNTRRSLTVFKADITMDKLLDLTNKFPKVTYKDIYNEGYKIQLERDPDMYVLHITDTKSGKRTEVRGKSGYESGSYDADDRLHQLLDKIGKSANISELINGEVVTINPKHPDATKANKAADKAFNEASGTLYHATYKPFLDSIMKNGLGGSGAQTQWEDSKPGYVYLAKDPEVARSHAEANEEVPDEYIDDIVVLSIDTSQLDQNNLEDDPNVMDDDSTLAYKGVIPTSAFVIIEDLKAADTAFNEAAGVGRVVKGVNTTVDVGPNEIIKQVKKYGNDVDRDGFPKKHLR